MLTGSQLDLFGYCHKIFLYSDIFQDPKDTPPPTRVETKEERIERRRREKAEQVAYKLEREIALWDPNNLENVTEDPFKTLFVARVVSSLCFCSTLNVLRFKCFLPYRITTRLNQSYAENLKFMDRSRKSS